MKHILVLPYWCDKEVQNFLQILSRWDALCRTDVSYSFMVAKRHDVPESRELVEACRERAPTRVVSCDMYKWTGWPGGANGMFRHVMEALAVEEDDGGFVFWFEHDVVPIYADWLSWLDRVWNPELSMAGQYMSAPWINLHQAPMKPNINGTAMYSKSIGKSPAMKEILPDRPFDFVLSESLPKHGAKVLPMPLLFDLWFFMPDWVYRCDLTKLMINGIKEINQRERVIEYILKNRDEP